LVQGGVFSARPPKVCSEPKTEHRERATGGIEHTLLAGGIRRRTDLRPSPATSSYHEEVTHVANRKAGREGRRRGR
jgi:hypothetical protein